MSIDNFLEKIGLDLDLIFNQGSAGYDFTGANQFGTSLVMPRQFGRMGMLPATPAGPGTLMPQAIVNQPYNQFGLVPGGSVSNQYSPIPFISGSNALAMPSSTGIPGNLADSLVDPAFQIFGAFLDDLQVNFMLEATTMDQFSSVVNAPRLQVLNGESAWISIGTEVPYVAELIPVVEESAVGFEAVADWSYSGTTLRLRVAVSPDRRYVTMYLWPYTSQALGFQTFIQQAVAGGGVGPASVATGELVLPTTQTIEIETVVRIPDGGTLLIGGQKRSGEIEIEAGVPVLNKIPILKRMFSNTAITKDEFTLLILIKPTILIPEELEAQAVPAVMR